MISTVIKAKTKDKVTGAESKGTFTYSLPETSAECLSLYGEKGVVELVNDSLTILLQNVARKHLADGTHQDAVDKWVYGVKAPRTRTEKDPASTLFSRWDTYSPEYQAEILAAFAKRAGVQLPTQDEEEEVEEETEEEEEEEEEEELPSETPVEEPSPRPRSRR